MVSGFDRYFQLARCMRDEDLRADRQPEHTQIDLEMSFIEEDDVYAVVEGLIKHVWKEAIGADVEIPFQRMTYAESMARYGTDKPDLRFGLEIQEISDIVAGSTSDMLRAAAAKGGAFAIGSLEGAALSRKSVDALEETAKKMGAAGLARGKLMADGTSAGIFRFFDEESQAKLRRMFGLDKGGLVLIVAGDRQSSLESLGAVRLKLAEACDLVPRGEFRFVWITEFPLFEWDSGLEAWTPAHHMFSMPLESDMEYLESDPGRVRARLYDLAVNGVELGSGSIRNHVRAVQERVMKVIGIDEKEAERRFGFLLEAFGYGAPPHGGIALGMDRIAMVLAGKKNIRDFIAFPKTTSGASLMDDCPSAVDDRDLKDLYIKLDLPNKG
jgi:aspartyl-tRNA synthetase